MCIIIKIGDDFFLCVCFRRFLSMGDMVFEVCFFKLFSDLIIG